MKKKEINKRIQDIASRVYSVDPNEPDLQQFAIEKEIQELIDDILYENK